MDDSFTDLESELKSLRLRRPAVELVARIGAELALEGEDSGGGPDTTATDLRSWKWSAWRLAGVAAAIAAIVAVSRLNFQRQAIPVGDPAPALAAVPPAPRDSGRMAATSDQFQPVAATNVLYDLKDEGTVYVNGETPARRLRYRYLDTYTLRNPLTNASLKWSVPRDEVRVVPASLN